MAVLLSAIYTSAFAGDYTMHYSVSMDTLGHYLNVKLTYTGADKRLNLKMPVWAPGYYEILDYPKCLCDFDASDADGNRLQWHKESKNLWVIDTDSSETVTVSYRIFANRRDVASSRVNAETAFIAPNGVFMYKDDDTSHPLSLTYDLPSNWTTISSGLKADEGNPRSYDNYCLILLGAGGGGLEHFNSQACYTSGSYRYKDRSEWIDFLAFIAHEYFHLYNVKTIRPIELGPFDYDRETYSPLLWFSEGITCYYETQILYRAGLCTEAEKYQMLSSYMAMDEPYNGKYHQSLRMASYDIWLNFMNRNANAKDVTVNYYFRGPTIGLIMDIEIQRLSDNKRSLDDLMRLLYNRYYKQAGRGFTEEEFWDAVDEVAGASMAHVRYLVDNPVEIDYDRFLSPAGIVLDRDKWVLTKTKQ